MITNHAASRINASYIAPRSSAPMFNIHWTPDHNICIFQSIGTHPIGIDIWRDAVNETLMHWPYEKPVRIIHDFSLNKNFILTTRLKDHLLRSLWKDDKAGRVAVLLQRTISPDVMNVFSQLHSSSSLTTRVFHDKNDACAWLYADSIVKPRPYIDG